MLLTALVAPHLAPPLSDGLVRAGLAGYVRTALPQCCLDADLQHVLLDSHMYRQGRDVFVLIFICQWLPAFQRGLFHACLQHFRRSFSPALPHRSSAVALHAALCACLGGMERPLSAIVVQTLHMLQSSALGECLRALFTAPALAAPILERLVDAAELNIQQYSHTRGTYADFLLLALQSASPPTLEAAPAVPRSFWRLRPYEWPWRIERLLGRAPQQGHYLKSLGRTLLFAHQGRIRAVKLQRSDESPSTLLHELAMLRYPLLRRDGGNLPRAVGVFQYRRIHPQYLTLVAQNGIEVAHPGSCLVYDVSDEEYFTYINEALDQQRRQGMHQALITLVNWLKLGFAHQALSAKSHNRDDTRPFEWLVDLFRQPEQREGIGRLADIRRTCRYPNIRSSGVADLAELVSVQQLQKHLQRDGQERLDSFNPVHVTGLESARHMGLLHLRYLGDYLLDASLLTADAYRRKKRLCMATEDYPVHQTALCKELQHLFCLVFSTYSQVSYAQTEHFLTAVVDFRRMARQLAYFMEPQNYLDAFDGTITIVDTPDDVWLLNNEPHHATALAARLKADLYWDSLQLTINIAAHHQGYIPRCKADNGVSGFALPGQGHDLGIFAGPWPVLELEKALYVCCAYLSVLESTSPNAGHEAIPRVAGECSVACQFAL